MAALSLLLIPVALGIVLSPLAIMALVAELLSHKPRANGIAYLIGWTVALALVLGLALWLFIAIDVHTRHAVPLWAPILRLVIGVFLLLAAVWVYRRGGRHARTMSTASTTGEIVAAAPQLPKWLTMVESFKPGRSALLGFAIFAFNPVDASCAILAAIDIAIAPVSMTATIWTAVVFAIVGVLPVALPVFLVIFRGQRAAEFLSEVRTWIAGHTNVMNAALLLIIAVLQIQKGVSGLL